MYLTIQQRLMMAAAMYPGVLATLAETLRQNAAALGLMAPGLPEQLALDNGNGVDVTANGLPLFRAVVRRRGESNLSPMAFGRAMQESLDAICYQYCVNSLVLLRVNQLPNGYIGLTLTVEA